MRKETPFGNSEGDKAIYDIFSDITDFIFIEDTPAPSDVIIIPGSPYAEPAEYAATLWWGKYAPVILPTGRYYEKVDSFLEEVEGELKYPGFYDTEWRYAKKILMEKGVPGKAILKEDKSRNTFENAIYAKGVLGFHPEDMRSLKIILVCQAFHARRAFMTFSSQFTGCEIRVCPVVTRGISREEWTSSVESYDKVLSELAKCGDYFKGPEIKKRLTKGNKITNISDKLKT